MLNRFEETIRDLIAASGKTDEEIARALGYSSGTIIPMFRLGLIPMPFQEIATFARVVGADSLDLLKLAIESYCTSVEDVLNRLVAQPVRHL